MKIRLEPVLTITLINLGAAMIGLPVLMVTGLPAKESLPWAGMSLLVNMCYTFTLAAAYRRADMSVVYPIARGGGTLLTTIIFVMFLGETVSTGALQGIGLLITGILLMTFRFDRAAMAADLGGIAFALLTAVVISLHTLSDGMAARTSGNPIAYAALVFVVNGFIPLPLIYAVRGRKAMGELRRYLLPGFLGGAMGYLSYSIAIWAMVRAPVPLVTAVRETSVLFGVAIAVIVLKEPLRANRIAAAALILAGLVLIRLG